MPALRALQSRAPSLVQRSMGVGGDDPHFLHQVLGLLDIDEAAGDDIGPGDDAAVLGGEVDHHHQHAVLSQVLAVPEHHAAHVADAGAVHQNAARGHIAGELAGGLGQLDDPAHVGDDDVLGVHAHGLGQPGVGPEMALLAVDGDKELGLNQGVDDFQLLLSGVAGGMEVGLLVADHIRALAVELVDDPADGLLVAGMAEAEMMIRSPGWISTCLWPVKAMR